MITSPMLRDTREARALGYCEIAKLPREALAAVALQYPASAAKIREAAIKIAISRAMLVIAMYAQVPLTMRGSNTRARPCRCHL